MYVETISNDILANELVKRMIPNSAVYKFNVCDTDENSYNKD